MPNYQIPWGWMVRQRRTTTRPSPIRMSPSSTPLVGVARSSAGRRRTLCAASVLGLLAVVVLACSPGDNEVLNPATNRTGLTDTLQILRVPAAADREHLARIYPGFSTTLRVARTDSVEAIAFLRFTDIPADTSGILGARLGLLLSGGAGVGLRVAAYEVTPDPNWAWAEAADTVNAIHTLAPSDLAKIGRELNVSASPISRAASDTSTVFVPRVVWIDGDLLRRWKRLPAENEGIALRLSEGSPDGALEFLSRQGQPDSARAANPALEYIFTQHDSVLSVSSPVADAYLYVDRRTDPNRLPSGTRPVLTIADWLPQEAMFRFDLRKALQAREGSEYERVTIQRAILRLHAVAKPDSSTRLAVHGIRATAGWDEATDPETFDAIGTTDAVLVGSRLVDSTLTLGLEAGATVRSWLQGSREDGIVVRSSQAPTAGTRFSVYSDEAADSLQRPWLEVVYSRPLDPRWGTGGGK